MMSSRRRTNGHLEPSAGRRIAQYLLEIGAVSFSPDDPFTWVSGLRAPVYCDNRVTISFPEVRRFIRDAFVDVLREQDLEADVVAGTATAGIPHAAWLADTLDLPMVYVRGKPKAHGTGSQIEGRLARRARVIVVEDLVSTGGSSRDVVTTLRQGGAEVLAVLAIFSYGFDAARRSFDEAGVPLFTLTGFEHLFEVARRKGDLTDDAIASIEAWRRNPQEWSNESS